MTQPDFPAIGRAAKLAALRFAASQNGRIDTKPVTPGWARFERDALRQLAESEPRHVRAGARKGADWRIWKLTPDIPGGVRR